MTADTRARGAGRYDVLAGAVLGLADPAVPVDRLAAVVDGIARCAVLDGWPLVAALATDRGVDRWRRDADDLIARVTAASREAAGDVRRLAGEVLARISASPLEAR